MAKRQQRHIPPLEWTAGLVSLFIVLGTIGYLVFEALQPRHDAPVLSVSILEMRESHGSFVVDVEIRNNSRAAAADVHVAGMTPSADGRALPAQARVDYVPGFSTRRASLVFGVDPGANVDVRVVGYARPD